MFPGSKSTKRRDIDWVGPLEENPHIQILNPSSVSRLNQSPVNQAIPRYHPAQYESPKTLRGFLNHSSCCRKPNRKSAISVYSEDRVGRVRADFAMGLNSTRHVSDDNQSLALLICYRTGSCFEPRRVSCIGRNSVDKFGCFRSQQKSGAFLVYDDLERQDSTT